MKHLSTAAVASAALLTLAVTSGCQSTADANTHKVAGGFVTRFHQLDTNNDGKVTYAEFDAGFADTIFSQYNRNSDGAVTLAEWDAIERADQDKTKSSFRLLDRNHDNKLTRDELTHGKRRNAVVHRIFERVDTNHDGVITEAEARNFGIARSADRDPANHP